MPSWNAGGLLTHPHTSAGRVPTERGYRFFAADVLEHMDSQPRDFDLELSQQRTEIDLALQATTEKLAHATRLLALVSRPSARRNDREACGSARAPARAGDRGRITSTGGVSKRMFDFEEPVDPGIAEWAGEYLNERIAGLGLGTRMLRDRLDDPGFTRASASSWQALAPAFTDLLAD